MYTGLELVHLVPRAYWIPVYTIDDKSYHISKQMRSTVSLGQEMVFVKVLVIQVKNIVKNIWLMKYWIAIVISNGRLFRLIQIEQTEK